MTRTGHEMAPPALPERRPGRRWSARRGALVLIILLVAAGTVWGLVRLRTDTGPAAFLPAGDPALTSLTEVARAFGGDPIVVLAESERPRALLDGVSLGQLISLEGRLARLPDVAVVYGPGTTLNQIVSSTRDLMATIAGHRDGMKATGDAGLTQFDQRYGQLALTAMRAGVPSVQDPDFVNSVIFDSDGSPRASWRYLVPTANAVTILVRPRENLGEAGMRRLVDSVRDLVAHSGLPTRRVTVTGTPTVFADLGYRVAREIPMLGAAALGLIVSCYLGIAWTRRRRHRLVPLAVTLGTTGVILAVFGWLGVKLSLGAVAFLPILVGIGSDFPAYVVHGTPRRRVLVTATASAVGFSSLALSPLPFVRDLGLALGFGVLLAASIALLVRRFVVGAQPTVEDSDRVAVPTARLPPQVRAWVLISVAVLAALGWVMLPRLPVQAAPDELAAGLASVTDARHAEDVIGSSGEVDLLLRAPDVRTVQALDWMRRAEDVVLRQYGSALRPAVSLPDLVAFLGPNPTQEQLDAGLDMLPDYLVSSVLSEDRHRAVISLGISLQDLRRQQDLLAGVRAALPPAPPGMSDEVVGLPAAATRGYQLVSEHRYLANVAGIVAAGAVLFVGLARRSDAWRAVLAAVLATGWGFAGAWLFHVPLNPLSVALGSLTTVTACEFTVLLGYAAGPGGRSLRRTVTVAALAAALGYLALTVSGLAILRQFGQLLAVAVVWSLLAAMLTVRLFPPADRPTTGVLDEDRPKVAS